MKRIRMIFINIILLVFLLALFCYTQNLYLNPLSAHKASERSIHYGPSKVVHVGDYDNGKLFLGKYDKWISCDNVPRRFLLFWGFGGSPSGFEYDKTKAVSYTWDMTKGLYKAYGIVNDPNVKKIDVLLTDGKVLSTTSFYDKLFFLTWRITESSQNDVLKLVGYDSTGKVIFDSISG